jgi:hypothetical protein
VARGFSCPQCGTRYNTELGMTRHFAVRHAPRPVACLYCDLHFTTNKNMRRHCNVHHKEVPLEAGVPGERVLQTVLNIVADDPVASAPIITAALDAVPVPRSTVHPGWLVVPLCHLNDKPTRVLHHRTVEYERIGADMHLSFVAALLYANHCTPTLQTTPFLSWVYAVVRALTGREDMEVVWPLNK